MKQKIKDLCRKLSDQLSALDQVDSITLAEIIDEDLYSPYFFISADVYHRNPLPEEEDRETILHNPPIFESNLRGTKDRFLLEGVPIRLEYKNLDAVEGLLDQALSPQGVYTETGTYPFYRLQRNTLLYSRSGWLEEARNRLERLGEAFWTPLITRHKANLEHLAMDLAASAVVQDVLFYLRSLSAYINTVCAFLFAVNRRFEPSGRRLEEKLYALELLPESFKGQFACLIALDPEFDPPRKSGIAAVLTKSLLTLE
ncbi:MAG: hypothetical protein LBQ61_00325 [Spirochaetales bacterium]|jgi:hypothetical protein|nr:hypothetical protein [Spirochaetales bacterium]